MTLVARRNFESAYERERKARLYVEELIEKKALELYEARLNLEEAFASMSRQAEKLKKEVEEKKRVEGNLLQNHKKLLDLHEELKKNQIQLIQSEKMGALGQLVAGIAHEINNPVGFVMSNFAVLVEYVRIMSGTLALCDELLEAMPKNEAGLRPIFDKIQRWKEEQDMPSVLGDIDSLLSESKEGLVRIRDIVQNLRNFARADDDRQREMDVHEGLEATLKIVWNEIKYKCVVNKKYGNIPKILCCPGQINQVFLNVFLNAAQAILEKGQIDIETAATANDVVVKISDTGCGIAPENISKIFDPFFTTKEEGKGMGLGLAVSHGIIKKHGGRIEVQSQVGSGSCFSVYLPLKGGDQHDK